MELNGTLQHKLTKKDPWRGDY